jgi:benzodiazapine receptor
MDHLRPPQRSVKAQAWGLVVAVGVCYGAALLGNLATVPQIPTWYAGIAKPLWTPPDWVFGPVWSLLYAMMAVAVWLIWRQAGWKAGKRPLLWFASQLGLNSLWSLLFFGAEKPAWAMGEILLLWLAILMTIRAFWPISRSAAWLLVPYLLWVSFASGLNAAIWQMNR